jgi:predicted MFS family arabinose efflux permease
LTVAALSSGLASAVAVPAADNLVAVIALVAVVAFMTMLFRTAQSAILPELVQDPAELTAANVMSSAVESVGLFVGPAVAAGLLAVQGPGVAFGACAVLFLVGGLLVLRVAGSGAGANAMRAENLGRARDLLALRTARLVLSLVLAQTVLSGALVVLYPALAAEAPDLDVSAVGLLTTGFGLGGVLGSLGLFALAESRRLGSLTSLALLLWSLPLLVLPVEPGLAVVLTLLAVAGGGNALFDVTSVTLLQRGVPPRLLGRAFGSVETVVVIGLGAGAAVAVWLDDLVGPAVALALMAAPLALLAVLCLPRLRRLDRELTAPVRQVPLLRALPARAASRSVPRCSADVRPPTSPPSTPSPESSTRASRRVPTASSVPLPERPTCPGCPSAVTSDTSTASAGSH